jgi:pyruvate dehydrogenase E2 component (dihydrolipoamide acetyltransferase)
VLYEFKLPDIGDGMTEGELSRWLVEVGQDVEEDQPVAEVQTDKVEIEISSPVSGTVKELLAEAGDTVPVGNTIVTFETEGQGEGNEAEPSRTESRAQGDRRQVRGNGRTPVRATPAVRRTARDLDVDLHLVNGSGPGGRVLEDDVRNFFAAASTQQTGKTEPTPDADEAPLLQKPLAPEPSSSREPAGAPVVPKGQQNGADRRRIPIRGVRRGMFDNMARSSSTIAHCTVFDELDVTELVALRKRANEEIGDETARLTYLPFIIKAAIAALKEYPELNASFDEAREELVLNDEYNIGLATDTPNGLLVPVVKNAERKTIVELAREISGLAAKGRAGRLTGKEMRDATFSITTMGPLSGVFATPLINPPQVSILAFHKIQRKPVVRGEDEIVIRSMAGVSMSFDHRVIEGAVTSRFVNLLSRYLGRSDLLYVNMG